MAKRSPLFMRTGCVVLTVLMPLFVLSDLLGNLRTNIAQAFRWTGDEAASKWKRIKSLWAAADANKGKENG